MQNHRIEDDPPLPTEKYTTPNTTEGGIIHTILFKVFKPPVAAFCILMISEA